MKCQLAEGRLRSLVQTESSGLLNPVVQRFAINHAWLDGQPPAV